VLYAYGPIAVLTPMVRKLAGVKKAFIYGSWAERVSGKPGADPGDIDVLLIMDGSSYEAFEIAAEATKVMGREVNVQNVSEESWNNADSGFVKTIKSRPLVELDLAQ
jgi:predicted nucleotidyltransferase